MSNNYTIDFTHETRSFELNPYTTNGPNNPTSNTLDDKAAAAATSLLFMGKGSPDYGERLQENMLHVLENFAGTVEPAYPISGQLWFYRDPLTPDPSAPGDKHVLRIFNTLKHTIQSGGDVNFVTIEGDLTARFGISPTLGPITRLIATDVGGNQKEYLITSSQLVSGDTLLGINPPKTSVPELNGWFVGGWEYLVQNNVGLIEELSANNHKITDLATPAIFSDAANKAYVDSVANANNELSELTDVNLSSPTPPIGSILVFNGVQWEDQTGTASGFLSTSGGDMFGDINMLGNEVTGLPNVPLGASSATSKFYVDDEIATAIGIAVPTVIDDLTDVIYGGPLLANELLQWNGATWTNVDTSVIGAVLVDGSNPAMTGALILNGDPLIPLQSATKQYVDVEIANAVSVSGDGVVNSGVFDNILQTLTLTRTNSLPDVIVTGFAAGGTTSDLVTHTISRPDLLYGFNEMDDLYWEQRFATDPSYPTMPVADMLTALNLTLGDVTHKPSRAVIPATGGTDYDIGLTGTFGSLKLFYVPGYDNLTVHVNGIKQYADEYGYLEVAATMGIVDPLTDTNQLWPGIPTGLNPLTTYAFQIQLNAGNPSDSGIITVVVDGSQAQNLGGLIAQMQIVADINTNNFSGQSSDLIAPFHVHLLDRHMVFYSGFPGADSSVVLTDGDGGTNTDLFASIVGGTDAAGRTYTYTIPAASINTGRKNDGVGSNPPAPSTWAYREVGRVGQASTKFIFNGAPTIGAPIELQVSNAQLYTRTLQP